jgi:hypothetical protein
MPNAVAPVVAFLDSRFCKVGPDPDDPRRAGIRALYRVLEQLPRPALHRAVEAALPDAAIFGRGREPEWYEYHELLARVLEDAYESRAVPALLRGGSAAAADPMRLLERVFGHLPGDALAALRLR